MQYIQYKQLINTYIIKNHTFLFDLIYKVDSITHSKAQFLMLTSALPTGLGLAGLERGISRSNFVTLDVSRFVEAKALDVGCGFGRWTMMLQSIGAKAMIKPAKSQDSSDVET